MGSLERAMRRAADKKRKSAPLSKSYSLHTSQQEAHMEEGIFCDCHGTLYSHSYEKDALLVEYLNAQHAAGTPVMLISTAPRDVLPKIRNIGLHDDILDTLTSKSVMYNRVLEQLIDDDPVNLNAKTTWHPQNPVFRLHMKDFLATQARHEAMPPRI